MENPPHVQYIWTFSVSPNLFPFSFFFLALSAFRRLWVTQRFWSLLSIFPDPCISACVDMSVFVVYPNLSESDDKTSKIRAFLSGQNFSLSLLLVLLFFPPLLRSPNAIKSNFHFLKIFISIIKKKKKENQSLPSILWHSYDIFLKKTAEDSCAVLQCIVTESSSSESWLLLVCTDSQLVLIVVAGYSLWDSLPEHWSQFCKETKNYSSEIFWWAHRTFVDT